MKQVLSHDVVGVSVVSVVVTSLTTCFCYARTTGIARRRILMIVIARIRSILI